MKSLNVRLTAKRREQYDIIKKHLQKKAKDPSKVGDYYILDKLLRLFSKKNRDSDVTGFWDKNMPGQLYGTLLVRQF
jgi:hypothetical protein